MPRKKIDGVIEAVRYLSDGNIDVVRAFEARGAVWSDHILLNRRQLVEKIEKGKQFVTGQRKAYYGSLLEPGAVIRCENNIISTGSHDQTHDQLTGVPVF